MVAEFGHRISLRPKVACRYHFPKRHGIGRTDNRGCRIEYGSSENKVEGGGNISHLVTGGSMAFHGLKHWCGTENSPVASTSGTSAVSPVVRSVQGGDYTCRKVSNFTSTAASR